MGVNTDEAAARVAWALTDAETASIANQVDSLPAGGDGIVGAIVFIFVLLAGDRHPRPDQGFPIHQVGSPLNRAVMMRFRFSFLALLACALILLSGCATQTRALLSAGAGRTCRARSN